MAADSDGGDPSGLAALHPQMTLPVVMAPSVTDEQNALRMPLRPVACWMLEDARFGYDKSFIVPEAQTEMGMLADIVAQCPQAPLSIFAHADPTGGDEYNKKLSDRRAEAVYGLLTRNAGIWESLHDNALGHDKWGQDEIDAMFGALGYDPTSSDEIRRFQSDHELDADGVVGHQTRKQLFLAYMDFLCARGSGDPFKVDPAAFLGQGADPDGKGDYQGCSDFNPAVVFSSDEATDFAKPENKGKRNAANSANRRIVVYLFPPGTTITTASWPCPTTKQGDDGCKARFWSDADQRRSPGDTRRTFDGDRNTFACRFYHGLSMRSPCERPKSATTTYVIAFDPATSPTDGGESYRLLAEDGSYDQIVSRALAYKTGAGMLLLRFSGVSRGPKYSLYQVLRDGPQILLFSNLNAYG